jgi:hypothetical protein
VQQDERLAGARFEDADAERGIGEAEQAAAGGDVLLVEQPALRGHECLCGGRGGHGGGDGHAAGLLLGARADIRRAP